MKKFRIIAFFVILTLVIVPLASPVAAFFVEPALPVYTALGDSIAVGAGGDDGYGHDNYGYVDRLIIRDFPIPTNISWDLSVNGMTSGDLLANLTDSSDSDYDMTRQWVGWADDITVSIGGNDLLQVFMPLYNDDPDFLDNLTYRQRHLISMQLVNNARNFGPNWKNIMKNIRLLNDEADVYVNTLYNPFSTSDPLFYFADPFIRTINYSIWRYADAYDYEVADVYTAFCGSDGMVHDMDGTVPLHPTNDGYEVIYDLVKALMD